MNSQLDNNVLSFSGDSSVPPCRPSQHGLLVYDVPFWFVGSIDFRFSTRTRSFSESKLHLSDGYLFVYDAHTHADALFANG